MKRTIPPQHACFLAAFMMVTGLAAGVCFAAKPASPLEQQLEALDTEALMLAVEDLQATFPEGYPRSYAERARTLHKEFQGTRRMAGSTANGDRERAVAWVEAYLAFRREALLANPHLDFDRLLLIRRPAKSPNLGLPQNWQGVCALPRQGYDDALAVLDLRKPEAPPRELFRPETPRMLSHIDLHWDGERMLFSMIGANKRWQIWEMQRNGSGLRQVTVDNQADVDNYDPCYLPDGAILFDSTRCFSGVPCVGGKCAVANLFRMEPDGSIRQVCFEQEHDWNPVVMNNGRVLYARWEYTDTPHYFTRLLMHMNPDGTDQAALYGSNSFWPNSLFYARPVPGPGQRIVAVVSGHHGVARMGELVLLDPARGRRETEGVVQRIPGRGQTVQPLIRDGLVNNSWPRFLHPFPVSDKHFLVSCKPDKQSPWGLYLVDVFDNILKLHDEAGFALLEPVPLKARPMPPRIASRVDPDSKEAHIFIADMYHGPGLAGVPRGTVKALRVFAYHYAYQNMGGHKEVAVEGSWEPKRILGTVPVEEDGSAFFTVPANTPLAIHPLDEQGQALQLMRSWMTAMPGETLSCTGCHESSNEGPSTRPALAARRPPSSLKPWYGEARGFSFLHEVQPLLERHCTACHDGRPEAPPNLADTRSGPGGFRRSYLALHPYVRRPGPESDYHLFKAGEYRADTSELIQLLRKGHHRVELNREEWERLYTWIDLNAPDFGSWSEKYGAKRVTPQQARRAAMLQRHAGLDDRGEFLPPLPDRPENEAPGMAAAGHPSPAPRPQVEGWPFSAEEARQRQGPEAERVLDLGDGVRLPLVRIPAGTFIMEGARSTDVPQAVTIDRPFWISRHEITNAQYARFDPSHDSRFIDQQHKDHTTPGYPANRPDQPVIRVSWEQARAFCAWLENTTGAACDLPTEAQWEYACRAGRSTPFHFGELDADFSAHANLADVNIRKFAVKGVNPQPIPNPGILDDFIPKIEHLDDGHMLPAPVGQYQPNAWGLFDMHGNVWEWTRSADPAQHAIARGGSWRDRPHRATASYRLDFAPWQPVFNVGFRICIREDFKQQHALTP